MRVKKRMKRKEPEEIRLWNCRWWRCGGIILGITLWWSGILVSEGAYRGIGLSEEGAAEARRSAIVDLSSIFKSEVRSQFSGLTTNEGNRSRQEVEITTHLPLLGLDVRDEPGGAAGVYQALALLDPKRARPLYTARLAELYKEIQKGQKQLGEELSGEEELRLVERLLSDVEEYRRHRTVGLALGLDAEAAWMQPLPVTVQELESQRWALAANPPSLGAAVEVLAGGFEEERIFVYPPKVRGLSIPTPFSRELQQLLRDRLAVVTELDEADYLLRGRYDYDEGGMSIHLLLTNLQGVKAGSSSVRIAPELYSFYEYKPVESGFDQLLQSGLVIEGDLRVQVFTHAGEEDLAFVGGEELSLYVKANKPCYLYVINHVFKEAGGKKSILLPLQDFVEGREQYLYPIGAMEVNRLVELGEFVVSAPFGVEAVQVMASTKRPALPAHQIDPESGFTVIAERGEEAEGEALSPSKAVVATRALVRKQPKAVEVSEAVLTFHSFAGKGEGETDFK